jgi:hypothetical protein
VIKVGGNGRKYDALAGFRRNQLMAEYARACVAFPGGKGTDDMVARAVRGGLVMYDFRKRRVTERKTFDLNER